MPPPIYQVIALITTDDPGLLERVQKGLSRSFDMDLNAYRAQLRSGGVCVARTSTLPEAEEKAQIARGIGADYRIVDPQMRTVRQGFGRRGDAIAPSAVRDDPPTLLGGFGAPSGPPEAARPASGLHPRLRPSQENPALAQTLAGVSIGDSDGPTAEFVKADEEEREPLVPTAPSRPQPPPSRTPAPGFSLDALDADDLVLLDGSKEEEPAKAPAASARAGESAAAELAFAPPSADEDLELEESARPAPPPPPAAPARVEEAVPEISALADQAVTLERPAPAPLPESRPARPSRAHAAQGSARRPGGVASALADLPGRLLLGGWFRKRPRLRIVVGFALALGLGSIVPACHARSVIRERVLPQLEDLSTAKAHGHILSALPSYRSPEQIEQEISSIKTRAGFLSFTLWLLIGGGLAFAWFRFT
jgi:hypothetical protein